MAVSLPSYEVSDLCIGKPPLRRLPQSATVAEALVSLKLCGESYLSVWAENPPVSAPHSAAKGGAAVFMGKICMVDVICHLCGGDNTDDPSSALSSPVSVLLAEGSAGLVSVVDRRSSVVHALDAILDGAQNLLVPLRAAGKKSTADAVAHCSLAPEDFVRFFLGSIGAFSSVSALCIGSLGLVRPSTLAVRYDAPALSAVPLLKAAVAAQTAVAVVTGDGELLGEISPSMLAACDETVAAAVASLSAVELMGYASCGADPPAEAAEVVKARLRQRGMVGMLELLDEGDASSMSSGRSSGSSSSDEETSKPARTKPAGRRRRRSAGRLEETVMCRPSSSLVAVMMQALAHRVNYVWVTEDNYKLAGVVTFTDMLKVFRELLLL